MHEIEITTLRTARGRRTGYRASIGKVRADGGTPAKAKALLIERVLQVVAYERTRITFTNHFALEITFDGEGYNAQVFNPPGTRGTGTYIPGADARAETDAFAYAAHFRTLYGTPMYVEPIESKWKLERADCPGVCCEKKAPAPS